MNMSIIEVNNLSKKYHLGATVNHDSLRDFIACQFGKIIRGSEQSKGEKNTFWALKDVSFEVQAGEVLGVIGKNGAGKSTLLKILSRITKPTEGEAKIRGRVGSLLEVGTGFHPELTGRENIFLNGSILGMKKSEIKAKFDEIVAFSEVEKFLDTPVKRYSSGMYVRLAFAVAAHLEPEILLVDEVLAVGDASFQRKCLGKMRDVSQTGRTILFISHNMLAVQNLCDRVIWLADGKIKKNGEVQSVVSNYLKSEYSETAVTNRCWNNSDAPGNEHFKLFGISLSLLSGKADNIFPTSEALEIIIDYQRISNNIPCHITLHIYNHQEILAFTTSSREDELDCSSKGLFRSKCIIPANFLNSGRYRVKLIMVVNGSNVIYRTDRALEFEIFCDDNIGKTWFGQRLGVIAPKLSWLTTSVKERIR